MFEYLAAYLNTVAPPEQRDRLLTGCELLSALGIEGHVFEIDQELELAENATTTITLHSLEAIVIETERAVLNELGVEVQDNLPLELVTDILGSLDGLTRYEDRDAIIELIDQGQGSVETLADLLPLLGGKKSPDYQQAIVEVNTDLLTTLREVATKDNEEYDELPEPEVVHRARERLRSYLKSHKGTLVEKAIREDGLRLGVDPQSMIDHLSEQLHELTASAFGAEMACIYLASGVDNDTLPSSVQEQINNFFAEIGEATAAQQAATRVLSEASYG